MQCRELLRTCVGKQFTMLDAKESKAAIANEMYSICWWVNDNAVSRLPYRLALHHKPPLFTWFQTSVLCEFKGAGHDEPEMPGGVTGRPDHRKLRARRGTYYAWPVAEKVAS